MIDRKCVCALTFGLLLQAAAAAASGNTPLIDAIRNGDKDAVATLLRDGVDINARVADGTTALHWAVYAGDTELATQLIRAGAIVNAKSDLDITPVWIASTNADVPAIVQLLEAGANPNIAPRTGGTPLMIAARTGTVDAVRALIAHGADVNAAEASRRQTALMWAVAEKHPAVVRFLLEHGANVHARTTSSERYALLCCQSFEGDPGGGEYVPEGGFTPLLFAARNGDVESATLLLAAGANIEETAPNGTTALVVAAHSDQRAFAEFLLERHANANADGGGYTALHAAVIRGNLALVKALITHGANANARQVRGTAAKRYSGFGMDKDTVGATPYLLATREAQVDMMRALKASGADVNLGLEDGTTPVMAAAMRYGRLGRGIPEDRVVQAMTAAVELGSSVNGRSHSGDTALHVAATRRLDKVIQFLAAHGAVLNARNNRGKTPLGAALEPIPPAKGAGQQTFDEYNFLASHTSGTVALLRSLGATQ